MYLKIHESGDRRIVAICDKNLIGKKLKTKDIEINITKRFYKGDELSDEEIIKILKEAENINIIGKKSVDFAIKNKFIKKNSIIKIKGIPHAHLYNV